MVLVSEGLTDDDGIRIAQFGEDLLPRTSGEKVGLARGAPDVQVGGSERSGHVFIADCVSAQAFNGCDAWQFCYFFRHTGRNGWMAVCGCKTSGTEIEISGQLIGNPEHDRLAETPDHDPDSRHHRDGRRKRANQDGSSAQGGSQGARGKHRLHAETLVKKIRSNGGQGVNESGNCQRRCRYEQDRGDIPQKRLAGDRRSARGCGGRQTEHKSQPQVAGFVHTRVIFAAAPRHRLDRRNLGSLARGRIGGSNRNSHDLRSEEHTSELQSLAYLVCRLLLEKKKKKLYHSM